MKQKFLFIDRDGTLIDEPIEDFKIDNIEKIKLQPDVIPALLKLQKANFQLIMITNQDNLGTHEFPKENFEKPHNFLIQIFKSQGINFSKILICPHSINDRCNCRKPQITLITSWLNLEKLDKKQSHVIGDRKTDMLLAKNLGIQGLQYNFLKLNWKTISNTLTKINRLAETSYSSKETYIKIQIWLDQKNITYINTGIKFFDHMLHQIATHAKISMNITATDKLKADDHHIVEDTGLTLGKALQQALGNKQGINRFGFILPMDECLAQCVLDISGRPYLKYKANYNFQYIGDLSTVMIEHFFKSLTSSMGCTLHINSITQSNNDHHIAENIFKAFGRTLHQAIYIEEDNNNKKKSIIPSSKGIIL